MIEQQSRITVQCRDMSNDSIEEVRIQKKKSISVCSEPSNKFVLATAVRRKLHAVLSATSEELEEKTNSFMKFS